MSRTNSPQGSTWNRWEPHIHTPGTVLSDQYGSVELDEYCDVISKCDPPIRALGITDYLSIDRYEEITKLKSAGKLPGVDLVFPNVEGRLDIGTLQGRAVNLHLLFSPDDPNHVTEIKRFLARLTFRFNGDDFSCSRADLIRLGKVVDSSVTDDAKALEIGTNQFKIDLKNLQDTVVRNSWAGRNLLIGVAASSNDGTSGVGKDRQFEALRVSIESASQIIFSGNPNDRLFWCGQGVASAKEIVDKYKSLKPCLHGSDAHRLDKVGLPEIPERLTWIKGDVTFESLRQACIEPAERVHIGSEPPRGSLPGQTITSLRITNATWMVPKELKLNAGLVAIIGARGSGKTALADFLAVGSYAMSAHANDRSFVNRAAKFLTESKAMVKWESSLETQGSLASFKSEEWAEEPRVQYLSQQFVDDLCSAEGVSDKLLGEIQRVIFLAHPEMEREGGNNFDELYEIRCSAIHERRSRHENELHRLTTSYLEQSRLKRSVQDLTKKIEDLKKSIAQNEKDRSQLIGKDKETRVRRHSEVNTALQARKAEWEIEAKKGRALKAIQEELVQFRTRTAVAFVDELKKQRSDAGMTEAEWQTFLPAISAQADQLVAAKLESAGKAAKTIYGEKLPALSEEQMATPLFPDDSVLSNLTISVLERESERLTKLIGADNQYAVRFQAMSKKIEQQQKEKSDLEKSLSVAQKAEGAIKEIGIKRREVYRSTFESFVELESELASLYAPLETALEGEAGALGKLRFIVRRVVDIDAWVKSGEELFDLRKDGNFRGKGSLKEVAERELLEAWESGDAAASDKAIDTFIEQHKETINNHRLESMDASEWMAKIWEWLLSTKHISVTYGLQYNEIDIERLSPGTRGIVLLLLYLAIDKDDTRPLIIDQPEENLDPQSVHDELVERFRDARRRRQIIIVTHNANLVVNTDADQVIVATAGEHQPGQLPEIKYECGGLESDYVRGKVCEILEGGEEAFRARALRLRLSLS
jgi:ABC-type lipoprotein export system ATPase subunit